MDKVSFYPSSTPAHASKNCGFLSALDDQIRCALAQHDVFHGLSCCVLGKIIDHMKLHLFKAGDQIIFEGEEGRAFFFIVKGTVLIGSEASESTIAELGPGLFFGEVGTLFGGKRTMTARAKTGALLMGIHKDSLCAALKSDPAALGSVTARAGQRVRAIEEQLEHFSSGALPIDFHFGQQSVGAKSATASELEKKDSAQASPEIQTNSRAWHPEHAQRAALKGRRTTLFISSNPASFDYQDACRFGRQSALSSIDPSAPAVQGIAGSKELAADMLSSFSPKDDSGRALHLSSRASVAVWSDPALSKLTGAFKGEAPKDADSCRVLLAKQRRRSSLSFIEFNKDGRQPVCSLATFAIAPVQEDQGDASFAPPGLGTSTLAELVQSASLLSSGCQSFAVSGPGLFETLDLEPFHKELTDAVLFKILRFAGNTVKHLSLQNCWGLTDQSLQHVSDHCCQLASLNLQSCWNLTTEGIVSLCSPVPAADRIGGGIHASLQELNLGSCVKLNDDAIKLLGACFRGISRLSVAYCRGLTNESLLSIATQWPALCKLSLQRCTGLNDDGWVSLLAVSSGSGLARLKRLEELDLSEGNFFTDLTIQIVAQLCPSLKRLNLSFCCALTSRALGFVERGCRSIEELDLSYCSQVVTDASLMALLRHAKCLTSLKIRSTPAVTDAFVEFVLNSKDNAMARLKTLNISNCHHVSKNAIAKLSEKWDVIRNEGPSQQREKSPRLLVGPRRVSCYI